MRDRIDMLTRRLTNLLSGNYTAIVRGAGSSTGVALVEVSTPSR